MLKKLTLFAGYATGDDRITPFTNYMVQYPFVLALFFLSCWADPKPTHVDIDGKLEFLSEKNSNGILENYYKVS